MEIISTIALNIFSNELSDLIKQLHDQKIRSNDVIITDEPISVFVNPWDRICKAFDDDIVNRNKDLDVIKINVVNKIFKIFIKKFIITI